MGREDIGRECLKLAEPNGLRKFLLTFLPIQKLRNLVDILGMSLKVLVKFQQFSMTTLGSTDFRTGDRESG